MVHSPTYAMLLIVAVFSIVIGRAGATLGEDFRVDNAVHVGDQKEPSSQSTTIFSGGVVYDCLKTPAETVVFDKMTGQFVLLNLARRVRTELSTGEVSAFIEHLQPVAARSKDPLVKFLAEPKFQEQSSQPGELILSGPPITYRLTLARETDQSVVEQYHEFCDWYARLNAPVGSRLAAAVRAAGGQCGNSPAARYRIAGSADGSGGQRVEAAEHDPQRTSPGPPFGTGRSPAGGAGPRIHGHFQADELRPVPENRAPVTTRRSVRSNPV